MTQRDGPFILALDQGTSSSRSLVFNAEGAVVAMAQRELRQIYPQPGWVEHDPYEIWASQLGTAKDALRQARLSACDIAAVGIANQRETTLLWRRSNGEPMHPAIVWQDRRGEALCEDLRRRGLEAFVRQRTGLRLDPYFSATKLRWLLDHVPEARHLARQGELAFGTVDTWLLWQLTGGRVHATDVSNASRTMMFNLRTHAWDEELLGHLDIPREVLPSVHPSSHVHGHSEPSLLGSSLPIAGMAGDQQSALFGQGCFESGLAKITYGTGCFLLMHTGTKCRVSQNGLISTCAAQHLPGRLGQQYALEGSVFVGGAVVQWLRDGLHLINSSGEAQSLAASVPDAGGVVFVPAFAGLGAPHWQPDARGAILGLTRGSTGAHIARAALESIAFQNASILQAMNRDLASESDAALRELRVDGGASVNDLLMQFQADLLGIEVVRPEIAEMTARGAANLAGLSTGVFRNVTDLGLQPQVLQRFEPKMNRDQAESLMAGWERAIRQVTAV